MSKPKLTIEDQINHMKNKNGILFEITKEEDAIEFLKKNNYYFKVKSYAKNYEKYVSGENCGKYLNLDFAYLQELSRLDMHFRKIIIKMTLDIEHFAKTRLVKDCSENELEDGYSIVREFLDNHKYIEDSIAKKANQNSVCKDMIEKYGDKLAIWNIVEILSFGDFRKLYSYYYKKYPCKESLESYFWSVNCLRNAAAHNSCLLNTLRSPYTITRNKQINTYVSKITSIGKNERKKKLDNPIIHDFVVTLYVYTQIVEDGNTKKSTLEELQEIILNRFTEHKEYFTKNQIILSHYKFIKKIIEHFIED